MVMDKPKGMKTTNISVVDDVNYGLYVWVMPDGSIVSDDDGNYANIESMKGDQQKIDALTRFVKSYGVETGRAFFWSGRRRLSDEQYREQVDRAKAGLEPDPFDPGVIADEMEYRHKYGR